MAIFLTEKNKKDELPLIPMRDTVIFPMTLVPVAVGRAKSRAAVEAISQTGNLAVFVAQKSKHIEEPTPQDLFLVGTVGRIRRLGRGEEGFNFVVEGLYRVYLKEFLQEEPYLKVRIEEIPELSERNEEIEALILTINKQLKRFTELGGVLTLEASVSIFFTLDDPRQVDPNQLVNAVTAGIDFKLEEKQEILELVDTKKRLLKLSDLLAREIKILEISQKIETQTQERVGRMTREAVLREKMKTIEEELGESKEADEMEEYKKKIQAAQMPPEVLEKAEKELGRLAKMSPMNPESGYIRNYLDWLCELPWSKKSGDGADLKKAGKILEEDHYGLTKIKERVLEYLAVHKLAGKIKGPILCFVGPPGTGKTSIGKSIARALDRKFVKVSLGGIRDEAEIRGHRRTYVGALPGRIIQGIKQGGTKNPIFMLDEIDKVGIDFRGDPSSALLEALDPEQNYAFSDHYLEVPFDLSDVMFITTANILDTIPPALRDRLEVIRFPGYTEEEKFHIAKKFLLPKQLEAHGLDNKKLEATNGAVNEMITKYTREAGVRNLERELATLFRKVARKIAEGKKGKTKISAKDLPKYLGPVRFLPYLAEKEDEVGVATGLAWTEAGGQILTIEVTLMPGKGNLTLTGQLGEVMKESAQAAWSYVRSRAHDLGLAENFYQKIDVHIHVPEGAIPKDGPSAGIAIATALASAVTKIPTKKEVGMTGEITLRGKAWEIGGVKEKVLAAHRAGLKVIILPKDNKKDLEDIPKNVLRDLKFHFVRHMDEVLKVALTHLPKLKKEEVKEEISPVVKPLYLPKTA